MLRLATAAGCDVEAHLRDTEVEKIRAGGVRTGFPLLVGDAEAPEIGSRSERPEFPADFQYARVAQIKSWRQRPEFRVLEIRAGDLGIELIPF